MNILNNLKHRNSIFFRLKLHALFLDKRRRFALQTIVLTGGLLVTQLIWDDYRFFMVAVLALVSYLMTIWSLTEDIKGSEWLLLFIIPVLFTASVSLFYFLLPNRMFIRLIITVLFALGSYASLLVMNIYNVSADRSIQLLRAAQSVGLLITLVVMFFTTNILFSVRLFFWENFLFIIPVTFLLSMQALWSSNLENFISKKLVIYSVIISLVIGELALCLSFFPMQLSSASLLVAATFYTLIGLVQLHFLERLFYDSIREYVIVFIFTLIVTLIATRWV